MKQLKMTPLLICVAVAFGCGKGEYDRRLEVAAAQANAASPAQEDAPTSPDEAFDSLVQKKCMFFAPATGVRTMSLDEVRSANQVTEYDENATYDVVMDSLADADTASLRTISTQLDGVRLAGNMGDGAAATIVQLRGITWLTLESTKITDDGLRNLGDLSTVQILTLRDNPDLTDQTMEYVLAMENLKHVILSGGFTDDGVQELSNNPNIDAVTMYGGQGMTQAAVDFLRQELPDSTITLK